MFLQLHGVSDLPTYGPPGLETRCAERETNVFWVVVSNIFYFHPYLGKISNLTNMFQIGWNHQLVLFMFLVGPSTIEHRFLDKGCLGVLKIATDLRGFRIRRVSNIFYCQPYLGKWSNLTNIFQMGWNHQPVIHQLATHKNVNLPPTGTDGPKGAIASRGITKPLGSR